MSLQLVRSSVARAGKERAIHVFDLERDGPLTTPGALRVAALVRLAEPTIAEPIAISGEGMRIRHVVRMLLGSRPRVRFSNISLS